MKKLWVTCIDATGTKWLKKGHKYLVQPWGKHVLVVRDEINPHRRYTRYLRKRFKQIQPQQTFKPDIQDD